MRFLAIACVILGTRLALAHDVPVEPSACTFDRFEVTAPDAGLSAVVAPATAADAMRIVYTVATATAQFQQTSVTPRAFTVGATPGTIAFPPAFGAKLVASGDLRAEDVALDVTLGGVSVNVPVTLTTAVVVAGNDVATGAPMGEDGSFTLVGILPAGSLPAPLDTPTRIKVGCQASPAPDLDQFAPAPTLAALAGVLSSTKGKLRGKLKGGPFAIADLTAGPAALEVVAGNSTMVAAEFPAGLQLQGGKVLVADGVGGGRLTVRLGAGRRPARITLDLPGTAAAAGLTGRIDIQATLVAGAVTARGGRPFRARHGSLRAGS